MDSCLYQTVGHGTIESIARDILFHHKAIDGTAVVFNYHDGREDRHARLSAQAPTTLTVGIGVQSKSEYTQNMP